MRQVKFQQAPPHLDFANSMTASIMTQSVAPASDERAILDPSPRAGLEWIHGTEPLAVCFSCDQTLPVETTRCPACDCATSIVRRCPGCRRILSAQHNHCIYCSVSFLRRGFAALRFLPIPIVRRRGPRPGPERHSGVLEATMIVALFVLSGAFIYTYFGRLVEFGKTVRAQALQAEQPSSSLVASPRPARRSNARTARPGSRTAVATPLATLPLPAPPPLRFTVVGGYEPPPLGHRD